MTQTTTTTGTFSTSRRNVLRGAGAVGVISIFGLPAFTGTARASSHAVETLYLSNSLSNGTTDLFTVDLDSTSGDAVLTHVTNVSGNFSNVDAIAATPDGETVVFVDRNSAHVGEYDVSDDVFADLGQVSGLPNLTVLAAYGLDGELYVASNKTNELYTVDTTATPPAATSLGTIVGATVNGADIVFDSQGALFLHSNADDTLYTVDYQTPSGGQIQATAVGADAGSSLTGLAVRDAGQGDLVGSSRADNAIVVLDKSNGLRTASFPMTLGGQPYSYLNGDMTVGVLVDDTCEDCADVDGVKYEFACTETDPVTGECIDWDFVPEDEVNDGITYTPGSFTSKPGESFEPMTVDFATDYCELFVLVKSGQELEVQTFEDIDGSITVETANDGTSAISFVQFFCTLDAATAARDAFPSRGKGR
jgi:hypothetical protein